jgi:hypothetical protein
MWECWGAICLCNLQCLRRIQLVLEGCGGESRWEFNGTLRRVFDVDGWEHERLRRR